MRLSYVQIWDGCPWVQDSGETHDVICCDCGSVHAVKLSVMPHKRIRVTYTKQVATTAQNRKDYRYPFVSRNRKKVLDKLSRSAKI